MTRVYAAHITGPDGELTPRNVTVSNAQFAPNYPHVMPLPRWEPSWIAADAINRTLDYGNDREHESGATTWQEEPSDINLAHTAAHIVQAMDMWAHSNEYTPEFVEHVEHAMTRLAMELTNLHRRMASLPLAPPDQSPQ